MKPKDKTDKDDISLFREQMADVRRLKHDRVVPVSKRPKPIPRKTTEDEQQVIIDMMSDAYETPEVETGEELFFARNGLQLKQIRKLKRGQFAVGAELDLHGMFVPAAREALAAFIICEATYFLTAFWLQVPSYLVPGDVVRDQPEVRRERSRSSESRRVRQLPNRVDLAA